MTRFFTAVAIASALALAPISTVSAGHKVECKMKLRLTKGEKTWTCKADQKCCGSELLRSYTCVSKSRHCL